MRNQSNSLGSHATSSPPLHKRLGSYLIEAGLVTTAQIDVALHDQRFTEQTTGRRMSLGEILHARGWVKEQTIEYLMQKIVIPERNRAKRLHEKVQEAARLNAAIPRQQDVPASTRPRSPYASPSNPMIQPVPVAAPLATEGSVEQSSQGSDKAFSRREAPIAKPLPSVKSGDGDVNWVG